MARSTTLIVALSMLLAALPVSAQEPTPQETFYRAFYLEEGLRKLVEAEQAYGAAAEQAIAAGDMQLAAKALKARAELLRKLKRPDEARVMLEKALALTPESALIRAALEALSGRQKDGVAAEVARILRDLSGRGAKQAREKLDRLGAQAVGPLLAELDDAPPHVLRTIATHLGTYAGEELVDPFARSLESQRSDCRIAMAQGVLTNDRSDLLKLRLIDVALKSTDPQVLYAGVQGLSQGIWWFETPDLGAAFGSLLSRVLARGDHDLRKHLLLAHWRQPDSVWPLVAQGIERMARSEDDATRELAVIGWSKWSQVTAAQEEAEVTKRSASAVAAAASELLAYRDWEVRKHAAEALPWLPEWPERIRPRLLAALRKAIVEPDRREKIGPIPAAALWLAKPGRRPGASLVPESFSSSDILDIYALVGSEDSRLRPHVRVQLRQLLAQRGLWNSARSKNEQEAIAAAGLKRITDCEGLQTWLNSIRDMIIDADALVAVLENEDPQVREAAYSALIRASQRGHRPARDTRPPRKLLEDLASEDAKLRGHARGASDLFHHPDLVPALRAYMARTVEEKGGMWESNVSYALGRLARLTGEEALPDIRAWLEQHPSSSIYRSLPELMGDEVVQAFLDLVGRGRRADTLLAALKDRLQKRAFISQLPPAKRIDTIVRRAESILDTAELEEWLRGTVKSSDSQARGAVATLAGREHLAGLWPELLTLLEDEDDEVRREAKQALEEIRWYHDVKASLETFGPTGRAEALAEAQKLASSEDPVQRRGAAFALAALGDPAAVPALLELLKDSEATVREAAVEALQRLGER